MNIFQDISMFQYMLRIFYYNFFLLKNNENMTVIGNIYYFLNYQKAVNLNFNK